MKGSEEVWAIIPARGGSKGLPGKNIAPLGGKPLIGHAIDSARTLSRIIVSTDDPEIARVSRACGAEVPFLRPADLATDTASVRDAVFHTLDRLVEEEGEAPLGIVVLFTTSPFRPAGSVEAVADRLQENDFAITVWPLEGAMKSIGVAIGYRYAPRGSRPFEGARHERPYAFVPVTERAALIDIDTTADMALAERVLAGDPAEIGANFAPELLWRSMRVLRHSCRPAEEATFPAPGPGTWIWARAWEGNRVASLSPCEGTAIEGADPTFKPVIRRGTVTWPARGDLIEHWNIVPDRPERSQWWLPVEGDWAFDPNTDLRMRLGQPINNRQEHVASKK